MNLGRWNGGTWLLMMVVVGSTSGGRCAAQIPHQSLECFGRWQGVCWGDGYHACKSSGFNPLADLPPVAQRARPVSHRSLVAPSGHRGTTFYDHFDAIHHSRARSPGCDAISCDESGCDSGGACDMATIAQDVVPQQIEAVPTMISQPDATQDGITNPRSNGAHSSSNSPSAPEFVPRPSGKTDQEPTAPPREATETLTMPEASPRTEPNTSDPNTPNPAKAPAANPAPAPSLELPSDESVFDNQPLLIGPQASSPRPTPLPKPAARATISVPTPRTIAARRTGTVASDVPSYAREARRTRRQSATPDQIAPRHPLGDLVTVGPTDEPTIEASAGNSKPAARPTRIGRSSVVANPFFDRPKVELAERVSTTDEGIIRQPSFLK